MGIPANHPDVLRAYARGLVREHGPAEVRAPVPPPGCSEKVFQAAVERLARRSGWAVYHTFDSRRSEAGFPDLVLVRAGVLLFVELKRDSGRVSLAQAHWHALLGEVEGVGVRLWRPADWPAIVAELTAGGAA